MSYYSHKGTAINCYKQVNSAAMDASPHQLISMLYDGILERIAVAKGAMLHRALAGKGERIGQAISIIGGLRESLYAERGGQLARNLDRLYDYMQRRLTQANMENRPEMLDEVARLLKEVKAAWDAIPIDMRDGCPAALTG